MSKLSLNEALQFGIKAHKAGNVQEADRYYTAIIKAVPDHSDANHNMGLLAVDLGKLKEALPFFKVAVRSNPSVEQYWVSYVDTLVKLDKIREAKKMIKEVKTKSTTTHLVKRLKGLLNIKESIPTKSPPQEIINQLLRLRKQGKPVKAVEQGNLLVKQYPSSFLLWNILGAVHKDLNQLEQARRAFKKVIELKPFDPDGFNNIGVTLQEQGKLEDAIKAYNKAISLNSEYAEAHYNLGNSLNYTGKKDAAIKSYKKAISIKPNHFNAYNNMGNALKDQSKIAEAIKSYTKALSIKPNFSAVRSQKLYQQALISDWAGLKAEKSFLNDLGITGQSVSPLSILSFEDMPERHRLRSENYAKERFKRKASAFPVKPSHLPECLRIGYFSADFKKHPVSYLMSKVIRCHNRSQFKVFGYSITPPEIDTMTELLTGSFDVFRNIHNLSDTDIHKVVRDDKIDIAIDLTGYTKNNRAVIFLNRAAPIQINYLGYPGTMGADFMDYIIADRNLIPDDFKRFYKEKLIYLPHHYQAQNDELEIANDIPTRSSLGLPQKGFVFCAINSSYKITHREFNIWMRLLKNLEGSVLWLLESNKWSKENLLKEASARGVFPERLVFAKKVSHQKYLAQFRQADLYLDTFNYNAGATASNALWAGLPVLTKIGKSYTARMASSLLRSIGLPELITTSEVEYEALALRLAQSAEQLASIKEKLANNRKIMPLFNSILFTKHLENGYQQAYQKYFEGKPPGEIIVPE